MIVSATMIVSPTLSANVAIAVHRGPARLGLHLMLAVGVLLLFIAAVAGMRRGWVRRAKGQDDLPVLLDPPPEVGLALAAPLKGLYLGTVDAGHWLDRVVTQGLGGRANGYCAVYEAGVRVDRTGADPFWIPRDAVRGARLERAHAGKVAGPGRIVVIAWSYGGRELETGFRGSDRARQPKIVRAVHELFGPMPARALDGEVTSPQPIVRAFPRLRRSHPPAPAAPRQPQAQQSPGQQLPGQQSPGQQSPGQPPQAQRRRAPLAQPPAPRQAPAPQPRFGPGGPPTGPLAPPVPARTPGGDGGEDERYVDPLTSPLGDVVRRMRDEP
jgi:carbamoyl-phosphate synthase small subunit